MSSLRVPDWNPDDVADWIKGLEDCFRPYIQTFLNNDIDGRHLMTISSDDLNHLNIWRIGHQELFMEAVEQLRQSYYHLDVENLQWLALKLSCKARGLFGELSKPPPSSNPLRQNYYHYHNPHHHNIEELALTRNQDKVTTATLSAVADIISSVKTLVTWIDRPPFSGEKRFKDKRKTLLQICVELATNAQRDKFAEKPNNVIRNICLEIYAMCDELIKEKKEPLVLQPSSLENVIVKKKPNEELEVNISSLSWGVHVIASMKYQGPTSACGRVEIGDEIVQVNSHTVVGWMLKKLVLAMAENPTEVSLTLKKRPQHSNSFGRSNNLFPNNFLLVPKRVSPKSARPKSAIKVNTDNILIDPRGPSIPKQEGSSHNPSITLTPAVQTHHRHTVPTPLPPTVICEPETPIEDEDDDSAFLSEADSRSLGSDVYLSIPKLHVALQRRATVTGASPTSTRPPVSIDQLWHNAKRDQIARSYSHDVSRNESAKEKLQLKFDFKEKWCGNYEKEPKSTVVTFQEPRKEKAVAFSEVTVSEAKKMSKANVSSSQKADNNEVQQHISYQVIIVGGVPHRQQSFGKHVKDTSSTLPVLRSKHKYRINNSKRRVSCKDLGEGECQGWLYQRKENKGVFLNSHKWVKQWCVLKKGCLYVYDDEEAMRARCFICLKGFNVSPAPESYKSKRFAFQIYRSGVSFQFCSESQPDLSKWMNKLGLAAIDYEASSNNDHHHHHHHQPTKKSSKGGEDYSETEDEEDDEVLAPSSTDEQTALVNQVETASTSSLSSSSSYQSAADSLEPLSSLNAHALIQPKKMVKSKSLDWKNFPIGGDTYHSLPTSPIVEVAKMSLAFEMNLDSTPPSPLKKEPESLPPISPQRFVSPKLVRKTSSIRTARTYERSKDKEWVVGDYSATLPASTPSYKSSVAMERRIYGSPKLARPVNKPIPQFRKEDLIGHRLRDLELWKPFRISSIPSRQDDESCEKSTVEEKHNDGEPTTPKPVCKPAMGISMIGKNRRGSENRSSVNQTIMATISQATQTDIGVKSDDPLARMVLHLHEADLHIDGTSKLLRRTNSAFSPHPDRRFSQILLHLRALHRTLVAKEMDVSVIDKLLGQKKITSDKLKKWMDENRHI